MPLVPLASSGLARLVAQGDLVEALRRALAGDELHEVSVRVSLVDGVAVFFLFQINPHIGDILGIAASRFHEQAQIAKHRLGLLVRLP